MAMTWDQKTNPDFEANRDMKWGVCSVCGVESWRHRNAVTCGRLECKRRNSWPQNFKHCRVCGEEFYSTNKRSVTCGNKCGKKLLSFTQEQADSFRVLVEGGVSVKPACRMSGVCFGQRYKAAKEAGFDLAQIYKWRKLHCESVAKSKENLQHRRRKITRSQCAAYIRKRRSGMSWIDILGKHDQSIINEVYKMSTLAKGIKSRASVWRKTEVRSQARSRLVDDERRFCELLGCSLVEAGFHVESEVKSCPKSLRRVDLVAAKRGVVFSIEAKFTNRTSRIDQCFGQSLVSSFFSGGLPVMAVPSDLKVDSDIKQVAEHYGVIITDEKSIVGVLNGVVGGVSYSEPVGV